MNACGPEDEAGMVGGDHLGASRGLERLPDADDSLCPGGAGALNDFRAIGVERWIGEMRMTVNEETHQKARTAVLTAVLQCKAVVLSAVTVSGWRRRSRFATADGPR